MNVLDKSFYALGNLAFSDANTQNLFPCNFIASKCFTEYCDKRAISGQVNGVSR